uniref:uncharacterized protein n=1 Tax=Myxine glutinosa TaxID=7769 RepID=UPI00358FB9D7
MPVPLASQTGFTGLVIFLLLCIDVESGSMHRFIQTETAVPEPSTSADTGVPEPETSAETDIQEPMQQNAQPVDPALGSFAIPDTLTTEISQTRSEKYCSSDVNFIGSNVTVTCSVKYVDKYCSAKLVLPGDRVILGVKKQGDAEVEVQLTVRSGANLVDCQAECDHWPETVHLDRGTLYGGGHKPLFVRLGRGVVRFGGKGKRKKSSPLGFLSEGVILGFCSNKEGAILSFVSWSCGSHKGALDYVGVFDTQRRSHFQSASHASHASHFRPHRTVLVPTSFDDLVESGYAEKEECETSEELLPKAECSSFKIKNPKETFNVWLETTNVLGSTNSSILSIIPQYQWRPKLTVEVRKRNSIKLTKKMPKNLKSCEIIVRGSFGNKTITAVSGKKPDVVLELDADQDYQLRLMCCGNMEIEQYLCESEWVTARTQEDVPRSPLYIWRRFLSSRQDQQTEMKILWKPLSREDARGIVVKYTISLSHCPVSSENLCEGSSNSLDKKIYSIPGNFTELSVSVPANDLTSICVFAWTSAGFSPRSCLLIRPLHMAALPKPRSLSAQLENNSLIVNWQSPSDGEPALGYALDWPGGWQRYPPNGHHHDLISDILLIYPINVSVYAMHRNGQSAPVSAVIGNTEAVMRKLHIQAPDMQVVIPFLLAVLLLVVVLATIMIQRKRLRALIWPPISDPVHCSWLQDMLAGKPFHFGKLCLPQGLEEVQFCTLSVDPLCQPQVIVPICHANNEYSNLDQSVMSGNYVVTVTYDGNFSSYYNLQA